MPGLPHVPIVIHHNHDNKYSREQSICHPRGKGGVFLFIYVFIYFFIVLLFYLIIYNFIHYFFTSILIYERTKQLIIIILKKFTVNETSSQIRNNELE